MGLLPTLLVRLIGWVVMLGGVEDEPLMVKKTFVNMDAVFGQVQATLI